MGSIPSISLPAIETCISCACNVKCYAKRMEQRWKNVRKSYQNNLILYKTEPETFWREAEAAIMMSRFFRFHVSGDIPDPDYFKKMVEIASRNPHCQILCFTKKFGIVNDYIFKHGWKEVYGVGRKGIYELLRTDFIFEEAAQIAIPSNLHIIFSGWSGLTMVNPFNLPEAHVRYKCGNTTARHDALECLGNCTTCAQTDGGCWILKPGEQVVFDEH